MSHELIKLVNDAISAINKTTDLNELNIIRTNFFGKNGHFKLRMQALRNIPKKERPIIGFLINKEKQRIEKHLETHKKKLEVSVLKISSSTKKIDISLPGRGIEIGSLHPITLTINHIEKIFEQLGFSIKDGPEIEDYYHNFDALNILPHHPARTNEDTFWFDAKRLLRTQTSGVQIRVMKKHHPPIRIISSGRVYRNDHDKTHTPMFHQMEGLIVDRNISFSNLKSILYDFLYIFFEKQIQIRFRTSYFPFTEPSAEIDIMGKNNQWFEILGCGMVHSKVLRNVNINPKKYSGFAFGIGIERLSMLRYGLTDLRDFFENDLRFLKQFK